MSGGLYKVEAAGNDFLLGTGEWASRLGGDEALVRRLCRRRLGLGADGALALFAEGPEAVRLTYRNADGGEAAFCGNGTRCAALAAVRLLGAAPALVVRTAWADIPAEVRGGTVALRLPPPPGKPRPVRLAAGDRLWEGWLVEIGVPHLVIPVPGDLDAFPVADWGPPLRRHPDLGAAGANVDFLAPAGPEGIAVRSWERGVEAETLSCASGVVAAALAWMARAGGRRLVCATRSGQELTVEALGEPPLCPVRLAGPARILAEVRPTPAILEGEAAAG